MKIKGRTVEGPATEVLVLPRVTGDIVFEARSVSDLSHFDHHCKFPVAPGRLTKDGFKVDETDASFVELLNRYNELKLAFLVIKSLEPSEIEWDKVNIDDPSTWRLWDKDFEEAGFSQVEIQRILVCVMSANSLDENKLKAARDAFLRGQGNQAAPTSGPSTEPASTPSGQAANGSE